MYFEAHKKMFLFDLPTPVVNTSNPIINYLSLCCFTGHVYQILVKPKTTTDIR